MCVLILFLLGLHQDQHINQLVRQLGEQNRGKAGGFRHFVINSRQSAGECLPLLGPSGWREHKLPVKLLSDDALVPQYLQVYWAFSWPS